MRVSSICMRERMRGSRPAFKLGHLSCCDGGGASRQVGDCFAHATGGGIADHGGHGFAVSRGTAWPDTHALPPGKLDDGFDSMKTGESIRPIVLY